MSVPENLPDPEIANIAARLRATRGEASTAYKRGFEEGDHWARKEAEDHELELLSKVDIEQELRAADGAIHAATTLAQRMGATDAQHFFGDDGQYDFREDFPSSVTDLRLRGFIAGAMNIYHLTRPLI